MKVLLYKNVALWKDFCVSDHCKYIGTWLGPGAAEKPWAALMHKYTRKCLLLADLDRGVVVAYVLYKIVCLSMLSYIMRFHDVPAELLRIEKNMMRRLVSGLGKWLPEGCVHRLPKLFAVSAKFTSITLLAVAVKAKVACRAPKVYYIQICAVDDTLGGLDVLPKDSICLRTWLTNTV